MQYCPGGPLFWCPERSSRQGERKGFFWLVAVLLVGLPLVRLSQQRRQASIVILKVAYCASIFRLPLGFFVGGMIFYVFVRMSTSEQKDPRADPGQVAK